MREKRPSRMSRAHPVWSGCLGDLPARRRCEHHRVGDDQRAHVGCFVARHRPRRSSRPVLSCAGRGVQPTNRPASTPSIEDVNRLIEVDSVERRCPLDNVSKLDCRAAELGARTCRRCAHSCHCPALSPRTCRSYRCCSARRPQPCRDRYSEDVLNPLAACLHPEAGEGVRCPRSGRDRHSALQYYGGARQPDV